MTAENVCERCLSYPEFLKKVIPEWKHHFWQCLNTGFLADMSSVMSEQQDGGSKRGVKLKLYARLAFHIRAPHGAQLGVLGCSEAERAD